MKEIKTVEECFYQIRNGANIKQGLVDGGYPITRIETIANDRFNRDRMGYAGITDLNKYDSYILEDGDLLMSHINSLQYLGRTVLYTKQNDEIIIHGMNLLNLKANRSIVIPAFIQYYFRSRFFKEQLLRIIKKSVNQASFTVSDLKKIKLSVPNINEQKQIVNTLDKALDVISTRKEELFVLDELIKARFVELFGHVSTMNSSPIKMSEVLTVNPKKDDVDDDIDVTFLPMEKVGTNGSIDTTEIRKYKDVKKGFNHIKENDVLFAKITPCMENGKATIARGLCNGYGNSTTELFALRCNEDVVPEYIFQIVHSEYFRKCAEENMTGTAGQRRVPKSFIEGFNIVVPPVELQNKFAEFVKEVDKSKVVVQKALDEAQLLFDSLMQQYFG